MCTFLFPKWLYKLKIVFFLAYNGCMCACSVVSDSVTSWTIVPQAPLSMGFSRQEYQSGLPSPSPGDLPDPGIEPVFSVSFSLQMDSLH